MHWKYLQCSSMSRSQLYQLTKKVTWYYSYVIARNLKHFLFQNNIPYLLKYQYIHLIIPCILAQYHLEYLTVHGQLCKLFH